MDGQLQGDMPSNAKTLEARVLWSHAVVKLLYAF